MFSRIWGKLQFYIADVILGPLLSSFQLKLLHQFPAGFTKSKNPKQKNSLFNHLAQFFCNSRALSGCRALTRPDAPGPLINQPQTHTSTSSRRKIGAQGLRLRACCLWARLGSKYGSDPEGWRCREAGIPPRRRTRGPFPLLGPGLNPWYSRLFSP